MGKENLFKNLSYLMILISLIAEIAFAGYYLNKSADQFSSSFRAQNFSDLATGETFAIAQRLNAITASDNISCAFAARGGVEFYHFGVTPCKASVFEKLIEIKSRNVDATISIRMAFHLSWGANIAILALLAIQLLVLISLRIFSIKSEKLVSRANDLVVKSASQVAHDIRSPLSALNMVMSFAQELPEEKRALMKIAIQRINDIANGLLQEGRSTEVSKANAVRAAGHKKIVENVVHLSGLIDSLISEKRAQFRDRLDIEIYSELESSYALFAKIKRSDLSRVLSNLVNNAVDAMNSGGEIKVCLTRVGEAVQILVTDNGKGIPPAIVANLGKRGITSKKESSSAGFGLGIPHAIDVLQSALGSLKVDSTLGEGTTITLSLPAQKTPAWFAAVLHIAESSIVVSVDGDASIHQVWAKRFQDFGFTKITHYRFRSFERFEEWLRTDRIMNFLLLIDLEIKGSTKDGLDVISATGTAKQAVLVTSNIDDPEIIFRSESLGIKVLPKALIPQVPIYKPETYRKS